MNQAIKFPFYAKLAFTLLSLISIIAIFYYGQDILIPLLLALLFAILLRPVVTFLNGKIKIPHVLAAIIAVLIFCLFFIGIFYFISVQVGDMANDWGKIKQNLNTHFNNL